MSETPAPRTRCDFCQSPIPTTPVTLVRNGMEYAFCTETCRVAMQESERVFTAYRGYRWFHPRIEALDVSLPQGMLRNSTVLLSAQPGTREEALQAELAWRTIERGEPVVVVAFREPPLAIIERFLTLGWNVLPYIEEGLLHFLDCFTYRVEDRERMFERMSDWNTHLHRVAGPEITPVHDPTDVRALESRLDDCLEAMGMVDTGIVVVDSLTEFGSLVQPVRAYNFVKDVRADVSKGRFVPVFAGASYVGDAEQFPHDLEYTFDGIVDLELTGELVEGALIKRIRVRKMSGALQIPEWTAYEFTADEGLVAFDPHEEIERSRRRREDAMAAGDDEEGAATEGGGRDGEAGNDAAEGAPGVRGDDGPDDPG